jgi:3-hydroxyacyl-CoA dehydrogenase
MTELTDGPRVVAVVGGGSIGVAFAVVFARAGFTTRIYEPSADRRAKIPTETTDRLNALSSFGLTQEPVGTVQDRIAITADLETAVKGAVLVQECIPEQAAMKHELFTQLAHLTGPECVIASSTSFIPTSESASGTGVEDRALVAHPCNPPYAVPVIELVPNSRTRPEVLRAASQLYASAGMSPVVVKVEIEGFLFNRLQGAVLREAYALVRDGVASVDDIDTVMRDGLGRRWTFMGPFETVDLNTRGGIAAHAEKMGPSYHTMGLERGDTSTWTPDLVKKVEAQRRALLGLDDWEVRVVWRDQQLLRRTAQSLEN